MGALTPGFVGIATKMFKAYKPVRELQGQLANARTVNRTAKIQSRIDDYVNPIVLDLQIQLPFTGVGVLLKAANDGKPWTIGDDCECKL